MGRIAPRAEQRGPKVADTIDEYIGALDEGLKEAAAKARRVIDAGLPEAESRLWHGHPVWFMDGEPVALLKAYSKYVTFGLWKGQQITDPSGKLEAGSRQMASVKLASEQYVDEQLFTDWLRQARELEQES
jgi:hypothetical protein